MIRKKMLAAWSFGGALLFSSAVTLAQAPPPPPPPAPSEVNVTITTTTPPAPKQEEMVESSRPSTDYLWVGGYWDWRPTGWEWNAGRWEKPPASDVRWVAPAYTRVDSGVRYIPGHWSTQKVYEVDARGRKTEVKEVRTETARIQRGR